MNGDPITVDDPQRLVAHLRSPDRQLPAVIVSVQSRGTHRYGVSPRRLASDLAGRATVWVLDSVDAAWELQRIDPDHATYGGAVRVAGFTAGDDNVIRTDTGVDPYSRIADAVAVALRGRPEATSTPLAAEARSSNTSIEAAQLRQQLAAAEATIDELRQQLSAATRPGEPAAQMGDQTARIPVVYSAPEQQLRHEITLQWLQHLPEPERDDWPLRDYTLSASFLANFDTDLAPRARIVDVVVDVLTRRAYTRASRAVHPQLDGRAGTPIVRDDGATAYRAAVKKNSPGGARLLWWERVDGTVELAWVGHHDDPMPGYGT